MPEIGLRAYSFSGNHRGRRIRGPNVVFVPNATFVSNRFEGLEVEVLTRKIAVREMSLFLGVQIIGQDELTPLFRIRGNPSDVKASGVRPSLASSINIYQGEEFDLIKELGVDPQNESLQKVNHSFYAVNRKTNQLKVWASCSLTLEFKNRSIDCLKKSQINLGYKFKVLSSKTDSHISANNPNEGWFRYYGLIEASAKNMTCLVQLTIWISQKSQKAHFDETTHIGCIPGLYKHTAFSIVKPTNRHFLLLCSDEVCEVYFGEFTEIIYSSKNIGTVSSQNQEIRQEFKVEFVKEIGSRHYSAKIADIRGIAQFIVKSKTSFSTLQGQNLLASQKSNQRHLNKDQMVNYYHVWMLGGNQSAKLRINEFHLLHNDTDLREVEDDSFHYLSPHKDRFYQAVYFIDHFLYLRYRLLHKEWRVYFV